MKEVVLASIALLAAGQGFSQSTPHKRSRIEWGISFGANYSSLHVTNGDPAEITQISTVNGLGYRFGLLADVRVAKHLSVEVKPELSFHDCRTNIMRVDGTSPVYEMAPTAEIAMHLAYKFFRHTFRPYAIFGPSYKIALLGQPSKDAAQLSRASASLDIGAGIERRFKKITLMPEIRYCRGVNNVGSISGVRTEQLNSVVLAVNFKK